MKMLFLALALVMAALAPAPAQTVSGNASLGVSSSSARVALPATSAPYVMIRQISSGGTSEVFYQLGSSAVAALTTNAALPPGGICLNVGPNTHLAAITAAGSTGLRLTRMTLCPPF